MMSFADLVSGKDNEKEKTKGNDKDKDKNIYISDRGRGWEACVLLIQFTWKEFCERCR